MRTLVERGAQTPLIVIATTRPEFRAPWSVRSHHSAISLSPLDRAQVARMVVELASRHALSKDVIEGVTERTGGVPLFVEEVTRLLLERGVEGGAHTIPPTLQQSIAARLDRLGPAREIAQIGAVIGRGFPHLLLQTVADLDEAALRSAVERLAEADILFIEGDGPQTNYRFKHALIQDAAYESLLRSRRQILHQRIAKALREKFADVVGPNRELIAHHLTQAGQNEPAIELGQGGRPRATSVGVPGGDRAFGQSDRTLGQGGRGSGRARPPLTGSASQRLKLQTSHGQAVMWAKGHAAEETKAAFTRVGELAAELGDAEVLGGTNFGRWVHSFFRGELGAAREMAESFLREAERAKQATEAGVAHRFLGLVLLYQGEFAGARANLDQALRIYDPERDREAKFRLGPNSKVAATSYLALVAWCFGDVTRARELIDEAVALAVESTHAPTLANIYTFKAILETLCEGAQQF